jgi:large subunit ribosomal protein L27e
VIIQPVDSGNKAHPFGHALVAGIERYPSKITRRMSKTRQDKRSKVKPFVKLVNYNHLMPTRYTLELEGLKGTVNNDTFKEPSQREDAKKTVKKVLEERYTSGKNRWFFTPLSMSLPGWPAIPTLGSCPPIDHPADISPQNSKRRNDGIRIKTRVSAKRHSAWGVGLACKEHTKSHIWLLRFLQVLARTSKNTIRTLQETRSDSPPPPPASGRAMRALIPPPFSRVCRLAPRRSWSDSCQQGWFLVGEGKQDAPSSCGDATDVGLLG